VVARYQVEVVPRRWVTARHPQPALLHRVDQLADTDLAIVHSLLGQRHEAS
jgi:hypothetical protein